jgi:hypothetical protein
MEALVLKWQQETGCSGLTDSEIFSYPEKVSEFLSGFYAILIEETPDEKLGSWLEKIIDNLRRMAISEPRLLINEETLMGAATIMTSQVEKQIGGALSVNPLARERVLSPEYGVLAELEAKKVGWENNYEKAFAMLTKHLQNEPGTQGLNDDKDSSSFAVRQVGRTNILTNLEEALEDRLHVRFLVAARKFWECVRNKVKSSWEFSSSEPTTVRDSVRNWLFRREI